MPIDLRPLILTARLEAVAQARFEALRRAHFPPERNQVPAHVSLFHQLPGTEIDAVSRRLGALAQQTPVLLAGVEAPHSIGNGVAYRLRAPDLVAVHAELLENWSPLVIAQDRPVLRPHVTVQNKVDPATARETLALLLHGYLPWSTRITGLTLWRYLDGPWQHLRDFAFRRAR